MHSSHSDVIKRLKRANGHLSKIIAIIEEGRPCVEVAQQMQAVYSAVGKAKQLFVQDHIETCIEHDDNEASADIKNKMRELKEMTKYL